MGYTREQIDLAWKVKATQKIPSDRTSLCGEPAQIDEQGRKFFEIPAIHKNCAYMLDYEISEEYNALLGDTPKPVMQVGTTIEDKKKG